MPVEPEDPRQSLQNLKGEIDFRAKLARQHVEGEVVLPNYYAKEEHDRILLERVAATGDKMFELRALGVEFSPFLELGAERGQRSLVLTNDFRASGVAADISYHQLGTLGHFSRVFRRENLPTRICCDANHLPFRSGAFPFVFCYGFLHHFPSLRPVIREIHRVLGDGHFYFDEEPFKRILKVRVYRQGNAIYSQATLRKGKYRRLLESFISEPSSDEVAHGIIENEDIGLQEWMNALSVFDQRDLNLISIGNVTSKLGDHLRFSNVPNLLLGGTISGLCRKRSAVRRPAVPEVHHLLACPDCTSESRDDIFDRPPLAESPVGFRCSVCGMTYPAKDGIIFLLPRAELEDLYPSFAASQGGQG
jgi:SAM-dependent methyltransferase/uncharacterized protein YbaR (Trm112 family)